MRLLVDTHIAVWAVTADPKLPRRARELIVAGENAVFVSIVSLWEIAIKSQLRRGGRDQMRLTAAAAAAEFESAGFELLPITAQHAITAESLPLLHRDAFDRMLVAQARDEPLRLLTADAQLVAYGNPVELV